MSPDEALIPLLLSPPDDHGQYQDLLCCMAITLNLSAKDVKDAQDEFLDILQPAGPSCIMLPIHNALLQPAQAIWHTMASCTPTPKHADRHYFILAKGIYFLFMPSPPQLTGGASGNATYQTTTLRDHSSGSSSHKA